MERVLSDKKAICFFIFPALIFFIAIVIAPIALSAYYSTLEWDGIGKSTFIGLGNYKDLFINNSDGFVQSVGNSLLFAIVAVLVQLPIALFFALVLAKGVKGESFFRSVYFIPVIIATVVIGQLWMKVYNPEYGLLNTFLKAIGLGSLTRGWLGEEKTALFAAFIPILWQYIGYHMLLMYAAIKSISIDIYEAAKIDGASGLKTAYSITIPMIKPMLKVCVTFSVIGSLKVFDLVYVLTNGGPAHASEVPSTLMVNTIFLRNMYGYGSSMAVFIIFECLIFTVLIQKFFKTEE
jgi:raffinose/stachyose/melibiose transport system permease protein